jgi:hypothetical protein
MEHNVELKLYKENPVLTVFYACSFGRNTGGYGEGKTPLLALKAASEAYLDSVDK